MFLDFQNNMGRTALIQSLIKNRAIAKLLIKAGARTDIQVIHLIDSQRLDGLQALDMKMLLMN